MRSCLESVHLAKSSTDQVKHEGNMFWEEKTTFSKHLKKIEPGTFEVLKEAPNQQEKVGRYESREVRRSLIPCLQFGFYPKDNMKPVSDFR